MENNEKNTMVEVEATAMKKVEADTVIKGKKNPTVEVEKRTMDRFDKALVVTCGVMTVLCLFGAATNPNPELAMRGAIGAILSPSLAGLIWLGSDADKPAFVNNFLDRVNATWHGVRNSCGRATNKVYGCANKAYDAVSNIRGR